MAYSAAGSGYGYPLSGSELSSLEARVDGHASAHERCGAREIQTVRDRSDISARGDAVLLESAGRIKASYPSL